MSAVEALKFEVTGVSELTDRLKDAVDLAQRLADLLNQIKEFEFELKIKQGE